MVVPGGLEWPRIRPLALSPLDNPESVPNPWGFFMPTHTGGNAHMWGRIAILIDGGFFLNRNVPQKQRMPSKQNNQIMSLSPP
jgi:hypothetical protein